ncbi:MAG: hypothetical protein K2Q45_00400 [Nitrosomonas sp.]|nr:hypothetical protein [Nitrosomonas sp.]
MSVLKNVPIIISSWRCSAYIILVWSDAAFKWILSDANPCILHRKNDSQYHEHLTYAIVHFVGSRVPKIERFGGPNPVLIYNASKFVLSLNDIVNSNTHARFFSLNQPQRITEANDALPEKLISLCFENEAVHALYPLVSGAKKIDSSKHEEMLLQLLKGTCLTEEDEDKILVVYPENYFDFLK